MKTNCGIKVIAIFFSGVAAISTVKAQVASWNFNNTLAGTGSANSIAGNASLGSTIAAGGAFNGSTVYYGEGNWPAGSIDLNAYLEFSITPTAAHTITVSNLVMQIRRSTTGTSGAGPNNWSLRSNLDGYAADLASGVLTSNSSPATTVTLGSAFINLGSKVTFRLYGYNATISSGGLSRFVYDDIIAGGSSVLPVVFEDFNVKAVNQSANISWKLAGDGDVASLSVERASEGNGFEVISTLEGEQLTMEAAMEITDQLSHPSGNYAYRLKLISIDGKITYSAVQSISFNSGEGFQMQAINAGNGSAIRFRVNIAKAGNYTFNLLNMNGNKVAAQSAQMQTGTQNLQMENRSLKPGIYILMGENGAQKISTKLMVL